MRNKLYRAMKDADNLVVQFEYCDSKGDKTRRVVSPIRFLGKDRFLALCLCREEPRQFKMENCSGIELRKAHEFLMPVAMGV